jgi:enoyl-CoA hydratase/carnithine racemase
MARRNDPVADQGKNAAKEEHDRASPGDGWQRCPHRSAERRKKSALARTMYAAATQAPREPAVRKLIRRIVLAGTPSSAFRAGADFGELVEAAQAGGPPDTRVRSPKPLVAAVGTLAVRVGTTMLLHCDCVLAAAKATLSTSFIRLVLVPKAGASLLAPMCMGYALAFLLLAMARPLSAEAAKVAGLVNDAVVAGQVDEAGVQAARVIAVLPAGAVALLRGDSDVVVKCIDVETISIDGRLQLDETSAAIAALISRKT